MRDRKFEWLEVMRGLAAVWVLLHHASQSVTHFVGSIGVVPMITNGYLGVDFFFVLSGFIIASSSRGILDKGGGVRDYVWARAIRIYVPYLPVGLGLYLLYLALPGLSQGDRSPSLFTSVSLLPSNDPPALSVAWTLVHEMVFYAIFSVWFYSKRVLWALLLVWALCILVVWQINFELGRFWSYFLSPLNLCFILGVGIFHLTRLVTMAKNHAALAAISGTALVVVQAAEISPDRSMVAVGFGLIVIAAASPIAVHRPVWSWLLSLGTASYAIYLVHNPIESIAVRGLMMFVPGASPWLSLVAISLIALASGLAYWWFYETPALRIVRKWTFKVRGG